MACVEFLGVGRQTLTASLRHLEGLYESIQVFSSERISVAGLMKTFLLNDSRMVEKPNDATLTFPKAPLSLINLMSQLNRSFRAVSWYVRSWFGRTISVSETTEGGPINTE